jgi:SPP1 family predicted phage head-tail adaptor
MTTTIKAGSLRHRVELQRNAKTQDPVTGEMVSGWTPVATVWAAILPSSGREFVAAAAAQSEVQGKIIIRYRDGVDASMRAVNRGKYYNILAVLPDAESGREHLTLMVSEGVRLDH